jgi:integrase
MASIEKRGNGYRITVSNGYDYQNKKIKESLTWVPPEGLTQRQIEKELQRQAADFEKKVKDGDFLEGEKISFAEFAERWLHDYAEKQLKPKTIDWYRTMLYDRIIPEIGNLKLAKIRPYHIMSFLESLQKSGAYKDIKYVAKPALIEKLIDGKVRGAKVGIHPNTLLYVKMGKHVSPATAEAVATYFNMKVKDLFDSIGSDKTLSAETVGHYLRCISSVMSKAVVWQVILSNPCERVEAPKKEKKQVRYLEIDEAQKIITAAEKIKDMRIKAAILIFLYTGIRKGELSALEWSDIDFDAKTITIQRNMQYIRKIGLVTNSTKTESGERIISMSQSLAEFLKSYKAWQAEQRLKVGKDWVDRNRLFTRFNGDFIAPSTVYHWVKDFMVKNGFPDMHVHAMRHTNISLLLSQGVDLITTSRRAGHSRASTTANIYAHALRRPDEAAAEKLESLLAGRQVAQ